ncbi:UNVERIFIED_CONTAM: hypothetical protein HDU68_006732, partial [Siphonaria sp. JEL0065]
HHGEHQQGGEHELAGQLGGMRIHGGEDGEENGPPVHKTIVESHLLDFVKANVGESADGEREQKPTLNPQFTGFGEEFGKLPSQQGGSGCETNQ